jgi:hypothetical protein
MWRQYVQQRFGNTPFFSPREWSGEMGHITDEQLRNKFKEFMGMCGLPKLKFIAGATYMRPSCT